MIKKLSICFAFIAFIACGDDESSTSPAQELSEISSSTVSDNAGSEQGKSSATDNEKSSSSTVLSSSSSIPTMKECVTNVIYNELIPSWEEYLSAKGNNCYQEGYALLTEDRKTFVICIDGTWDSELIKICPAETEKSSSSSVPPKSSSSSAISSSAVQKSCHLYDKAPTVIGCEGKSKPNWKFLNPDVEYHCLVDERDGQFYATVKIGEQTWMAENLAYADEEKTPNLAGGHWCDSDADSCALYGQLYNFMSVMNFNTDEMMEGNLIKDTLFGKWEKNQQGICPSGWHVPTVSEWMTLGKAVGAECEDESQTSSPDCSGGIVKLRSTCGWEYDSDGNEDISTNESGFALLPVSNTYGSQLGPNGKTAYVWTSTAEYCSICANNQALAYHIIATTGKDWFRVQDGTLLVRGRSLRCVKD
ncbi:MAG: hypothetical protein J5791_05060 [Fibrobacter sp.]|nr:hypothetical protein [Fibrobacter sp.]